MSLDGEFEGSSWLIHRQRSRQQLIANRNQQQMRIGSQELFEPGFTNPGIEEDFSCFR